MFESIAFVAIRKDFRLLTIKVVIAGEQDVPIVSLDELQSFSGWATKVGVVP